MWVAVALALVAAVPAAAADGGRWSEPVRLLPEDAFAWFADLAVEPTGRVHLVWGDSVEGYDRVLHTSRQGTEWTPVVDLAALPQRAGREATRPTLLLESAGRLHLAFRTTRIYYTTGDVSTLDSAPSWLWPRRLSAGQVAYYSALARADDGRLHVVYTENVYDGTNPACEQVGCYHLFHRSSDDAGRTWSAPHALVLDPSQGAAKPQIVTEGRSTVHVVWDAGPGGGLGQLGRATAVAYAGSRDGGATWSPPAAFPAPFGRARNVAIARDGEGRLLVVWLGLPEDLVYFQVSADEGRTWSAPRPLPGVWGGWSAFNSLLDGYAMARAPTGLVHLVLVGRTERQDNRLAVMHLVWDRGAWSAPTVLVRTAALWVPEWPRLAVGPDGELHATWQVRNPTLTRSGVWYAYVPARPDSNPPALASPGLMAGPSAGPRLFVAAPGGDTRPPTRRPAAYPRDREVGLVVASLVGGVALAFAVRRHLGNRRG